MEHGSEEMYRKELRERQKGGPMPCAPCKTAHAKEIGTYRAAKPPRDRSAETKVATARRRALNRLAAEYSERFADLLADEKADAGL
jgi:hypothetical protein